MSLSRSQAFSSTRLRTAAAVFAFSAGLAAAADAYPSRPLTLLVPFPPGGTTDVIGRSVAQGMARQLGQSVIVENKSGAGGTVGAAQVLRSPADGYTLLLGGPSDQVNAPLLASKPPYDPARDFEPVGCVVRAPNLLVVNAKLPVQSVADLVRIAKAEPGKLNFASAGNGNSSHLLGEMLAHSAGISITHVPYRGNAPAITDTIGGQVQIMFANPLSVAQHIKTGALRAIGTTARSRSAAFPGVPTLREAGLPIENYSWSCLVVAAKTPPDMIDKLQAGLSRALADPSMVKAIEDSGGEKFSPTREEARKFIASERAIWGDLIRTRKIHAD